MPQPSVGIVIPCFNQKQFLATAIESALTQTVPPQELIVVDDGSKQDLSKVVSAFPAVRLIRQENRGLAGARNTGARAAAVDKLLFLDADDRLLPNGIEAGLRCFSEHPHCAFVYGAHRILRGDQVSETFHFASSHADMIECNWVGMIATAMFDRSKLLEIGGFDESLGMCEDWDAYLRLSRHFQFASHQTIVADYIRHKENASNDLHRLWKWIQIVRDRERMRGLDAQGERAWREGEQVWERMLGPDQANGLLKRAALKVARMARLSR